jgi:hypothetical protein
VVSHALSCIAVSDLPIHLAIYMMFLQCSLDRDKPHALESHLEKINALFAGQTLEEIYAHLRLEGSDWSKAQLETLNKMVSLLIFVS